jgi:hypothetical protein
MDTYRQRVEDAAREAEHSVAVKQFDKSVSFLPYMLLPWGSKPDMTEPLCALYETTLIEADASAMKLRTLHLALAKNKNLGHQVNMLANATFYGPNYIISSKGIQQEKWSIFRFAQPGDAAAKLTGSNINLSKTNLAKALKQFLEQSRSRDVSYSEALVENVHILQRLQFSRWRSILQLKRKNCPSYRDHQEYIDNTISWYNDNFPKLTKGVWSRDAASPQIEPLVVEASVKRWLG